MPWAHDLVRFAILTGLRQAEQFRLRWQDVHGNVLTIPLSKSGRERHVPLNAEAQTILGRTPPVGRYVFTMPRGGPIRQGNFCWKVFMPAIAAAGIEDFRWHDLRHTFASRLAMAGVPLFTISKLLGHASVRMTERYAHLSPGLLHDAVALLGAKNGKPTTAPKAPPLPLDETPMANGPRSALEGDSGGPPCIQ